MVTLNLRERARGRVCTVDAALRLRQSQRRTCRRHNSTLDDVLKFTNVTWPRTVLQRGDHIVRDFLNLLAMTLGELADEVGNQEGDVVGAFAQRRHWDREYA